MRTLVENAFPDGIDASRGAGESALSREMAVWKLMQQARSVRGEEQATVELVEID